MILMIAIMTRNYHYHYCYYYYLDYILFYMLLYKLLSTILPTIAILILKSTDSNMYLVECFNIFYTQLLYFIQYLTNIITITMVRFHFLPPENTAITCPAGGRVSGTVVPWRHGKKTTVGEWMSEVRGRSRRFILLPLILFALRSSVPRSHRLLLHFTYHLVSRSGVHVVNRSEERTKSWAEGKNSCV